MPKSYAPNKRTTPEAPIPVPRFADPAVAAEHAEPLVHVYGNGVVCDTDDRGYSTPGGQDPLGIVVDTQEGYVRLWAEATTLRWRFREQSLAAFQDPEAAKRYIRRLMAEGIAAWGRARPVNFSEQRDLWDFEVDVVPSEQCSPRGCVLASAFFPDKGRHALKLYPTLFRQTRAEQVETMAHEFGHVFGLRHFFADVAETAFPAEVFGTHSRFTIMNYGPDSRMTETDRADLKRLYKLAWTGELTEINGTEIRLMRPYHVDIGLPRPPVAFRPRSEGLAAYELAANGY